jgi:hypothetical protein
LLLKKAKIKTSAFVEFTESFLQYQIITTNTIKIFKITIAHHLLPLLFLC